MSNRRDDLIRLTEEFVDAFNRMNLDDVINFFATDGVYEDSTGGRHVGHEAIRTAFEPLVGGSRGKIRFDGEDTFVEAESGKVLASWRVHQIAACGAMEIERCWRPSLPPLSHSANRCQQLGNSPSEVYGHRAVRTR